eukprot:372739-Rhodomonas_salina.2
MGESPPLELADDWLELRLSELVCRLILSHARLLGIPQFVLGTDECEPAILSSCRTTHSIS